MARLLLIRHCESSGPRPEAPLTVRGHAQAGRLAVFLGGYPVDALVTSPYQRARETIAPFAASSGLDVAVDGRLAERRMSADPDPAWREHVRRAFVDPDHRLPGGESGRETRRDERDRRPAGGGHRLPVAVSHGQLMSLLLNDSDPRFGFAGWEAPPTRRASPRHARRPASRVWRDDGDMRSRRPRRRSTVWSTGSSGGKKVVTYGKWRSRGQRGAPALSAPHSAPGLIDRCRGRRDAPPLQPSRRVAAPGSVISPARVYGSRRRGAWTCAAPVEGPTSGVGGHAHEPERPPEGAPTLAARHSRSSRRASRRA
jgi:2,3-bisphosphoglycerate-dependent phosphoglycerate mutase